MDIWVYRDFTLAGVIPQYTSFEWRRRFTAPGEFSLSLPFTREYFQLLQVGDVVFHRQHNEAAFVEEVNVISARDSSRTLTVRGRFVSSLLDRRVVNFSGSGDFVSIVSTLLQQNFINPTNPNRRVQNLRIVPFAVRASTISAKLDNDIFLDRLSSMLLSRSIGLRVDYNTANRSFDFSLYEGNESGAIFSSEYKNLLEQDYYKATRNLRTTCYVDEFVYGDEFAGLDRREIRTMQLEEEGSMSAETTARLFLLDFRSTETFDAVLNPQSKQFEYGVDWELGDIVSCRNSDFGIDITKNILEIVEYYDLNGLHITVIFGDYLRTLNDQVRSEISWQKG